jgi:hypothetical protein
MSNYPFATFPLTKKIGIVNPAANLDARYGPWPTLNDALTGFSSAVREVGLTVAVSGIEGTAEYWYKNGITNNDLILKSAASNLYQDLTGNWQSTYLTVCALSASWEETADIIPTITNYLSTNNVLISALTITNPFSGINSLTITGNISGNNLRTSFNQGSATGNFSFAVNSGRAFGNNSHAEGNSTIASGPSSHAEGLNTVASGGSSHAEGATTIATGLASHSEGGFTEAFGTNSHAEGSRTIARGEMSHAAGFRATAAQDCTYAWSDGNVLTNTENVSTTRSGQYMVSASGGMFIPGRVGIGTDSINNALTVVGTISTSQHGSSELWNSTYVTVCALSSQWDTTRITILTGAQINLNTNAFTTFTKRVTASNTFTYTGFTSGKTITVYLTAGHTDYVRHYFPSFTFINKAGEGNVVFTFDGYITKLTLQNTGTQVIGTTNLISLEADSQIQAPTGFSLLLDNYLGFVKQENGDYILL